MRSFNILNHLRLDNPKRICLINLKENLINLCSVKLIEYSVSAVIVELYLELTYLFSCYQHVQKNYYQSQILLLLLPNPTPFESQKDERPLNSIPSIIRIFIMINSFSQLNSSK